MNTKQDKVKFIQELENESKIHEILEELLPEMGYSDVRITHEKGSNSEYGKDLVCSDFDTREKRKKWIAFVVKHGVISGSASKFAEVEAQVHECFTYEYKSPVLNERIRINEVKVVTNRHFSNAAEAKILENKDLIERPNVSFWDFEKLILLIDEFYPKFWYRGSKSYKKYIERFENRIRTDTISKCIGIDDRKVQKVLDCFINPRLFERVPDENGNIVPKVRSSNSIIDLPQNSIITGQPGCGKSTFFKHLAKEIILQNSLRSNVDFYPILITFRDIVTSQFDLYKALDVYFKSDWNKDLSIDINDILLKNGCAIFIDALDEVAKPELKEKALECIRDFNVKYTNIKIICSSRPSDYIFDRSIALGFKMLEIDDLNRTQVTMFLNSYFGENLIKSKALLKSLQDTGLLEKLPKTPLTLALITVIFEEQEKEIPATISDLYKYFVELLISKSNIRTTTDIIEIGIKHRLLSFLAFEIHANNNISLPVTDVKDLIKAYSLNRGQPFDVDQVLDEIIEHTGLVFISENGEFQFKHLSFQEYFTAIEIYNHRQDKSQILVEKFNKIWWQNVALFYAGISKDAPQFLKDIIDKSKPTSFIESITNTAGIGKLLQALYNTPVAERKLGIDRTIENTLNGINFLITTDDTKFLFWKGFSKYALYQIMGGWFHINHRSVTLVEPLSQMFDEKFSQISSDLTEQESFNLEFSLFLMATITCSSSSSCFREIRKLVENMRSQDLSLWANIHTTFRRVYAELTKIQQQSDDVQSTKNKLTKIFRSISNPPKVANKQKYSGIVQKYKKPISVSDIVNKPLLTNEEIKAIRENYIKNKIKTDDHDKKMK